MVVNCMYSLRETAKHFSRGAAHCTFVPAVSGDPVSLHLCQHLVLSLFFILDVLGGMWWCLITILICAFFSAI